MWLLTYGTFMIVPPPPYGGRSELDWSMNVGGSGPAGPLESNCVAG